MPAHALAGHLVVITAPIATLLALVYALRPRARPGMRIPLLVAAAVNGALAAWAATAGSDLYAALTPSTGGATNPGTLARDHAGAGDLLTVASVVLVAVLVFGRLSPQRSDGDAPHAVAAGLLLVGALFVAWTTATTLGSAVESVWSHHEVWSALPGTSR